MNSNIEWIELFMAELEARDKLILFHQKMLENISDSLAIAIWAKNRWGRFIYANKVCCDTILRCSGDEALNLSDEDFVEDALAQVCIESDQRVINQKRTIRFIEHAVYPDRDMWISSIKSLWIKDDEIIGTVGIGTNITDQISPEMREKYKSIELIEISLDTEICDIFNGIV